MTKVTFRDVILANVFATILLLVVVVIWIASALVESNAITVFHRPQPSSAEAFYKVGRYDLLRDSAVMCESRFNKLVVDTFHGQLKADWTTSAVALCAIAMFLLNVFSMRSMRREMDLLRSNHLMQSTGQKPAGD